MARFELPPPEREQRFNDVLADYLDALETGQPEDREALLQRHPDLADDFRAFFARAEQVQGLAAPLRATAAAGSSSADASIGSAERSFPSLPADQFRIVREVGRGGMGVVYEAMELSLGRRVALKVLRREDQADPRALERFRREARIVARLHHTNIVPIFQVGEHEGLHYFAMEFIDGRGLDKVLHELRQPPATANALADGTRPLTPPPSAAPPASGAKVQDSALVPTTARSGILSADRYREAARIGVQAAEALAYAHEHGILHRDIKPSNLLLDRDGTVWVTDFGLAKEGQEQFTDPGEVVGTLRYLAPERFRGQVDAKSDVYSLGATLYELLTLRPVHDEADRAKLMACVLHDEPARPRQIDARIPRDLETIVLKALAKDPAGRYQSARELADDLRRFLDDAPIQARRASLFERGWRWCRRNPAIAAASSAAVAALVIGLGVALWQWQRAEDAAQRAEANATQAKKDFDMAFQTMDQMLGGVTDDHLMAFPHQDMTRVARLEGAVRLYRNLLQGKEARPEVRLALARAHCWLGQLHSGANDQQQSLRSLDEALALVEDFPPTEANDVEHRRLAAVIYTYRGSVKAIQHQIADAETDYRQALARWDALSAERPDAPAIAVGRTFTLLYLNAALRATSRLDEAEPIVRQAVALAEALPADERNRSWLLGYGLRDLAVTLERNGSITESERVLDRALECFERAARETHQRPSRSQHERAVTLRNLAQRRTASAEAERLYEQSIAISERLVAEDPEMAYFRVGLAETLNHAGVLLRQSRPQEGEKALERSVSLWKELVAKFPEIHAYHVSLGGAEHNLAQARAARGDVTGARALLEEAIKQQELVVKTNHEQAKTLEFLHNHYGVLADLLRRLGEPQEAERIVLRQQALAHELAERDGKSPLVRVFQARACQNLVVHRRESKQPVEAVAACVEATGHWRRLAADFPNDSKYANQLGGILNDWAIALRDQRRWADMIPLVDEAIQLQEAAIRARPEEPTYQQFLCNHYAVRADADFNLGDHAHVIAAASALRERLPDRFDNFIWAARVARCIPLARKDAHLSQDKRDELSRQYGDMSITFLRAAQQQKSKNLPQIHTQPAFQSLQNRTDFQELLALVPRPATKK